MDTTSTDAATASTNIPYDARKLLTKLQKRVDASEKKWKYAFDRIKADRRYIANRRKRAGAHSDPSDDDPLSIPEQKANIVYATLQGLLPYIYAKNPAIEVRPSQQVEPATSSYADVGRFATTMELVVNKELLNGGLKAVVKQTIREAMISKVGLIKVAYQIDRYKDPIIEGRMRDTAELLANVRAKASQLSDHDTSDADKDALEEELQNQLQALQEQVDVVVAEQLALYTLPVDDFRMDTNVDTLYKYKQAAWMAHGTWMTKDALLAEYDIAPEDMKDFAVRQRTEEGIPDRANRTGESVVNHNEADDGEEGTAVIRVWEFWDKITRTVYTWAEGGKTWLKDPWQPKAVGARWYPFFLLGFNWLDTSCEWPLSDVELLAALGEEYNALRKQAYDHRRLSIPHWVGDKTSMASAQDVQAFTHAQLGEVVLVNANGRPLDQVFQPAIPPPYNVAIYDTAPTRADIEWVSGLGDAQRGSILRAKTATEAGIQQEGLNTRIEEKRDAVEDLLEDVAKYAAELLVMAADPNRVSRIAGAGAFWPSMHREELFTLVEVDIEAGSTGKPNRLMELQAWADIMPQIREDLGVIMQLRAQGVPDRDNPFVQLLIETLKRVDERIDIEKFLPGEPVQPAGTSPIIMPGQERAQTQPAPVMGANAQPQIPADGFGVQPQASANGAGVAPSIVLPPGNRNIIN